MAGSNKAKELIVWIEEELAGKTVVGVRVKTPQLWLQTKDGWVEITVEGDCCSEAFIDAVRLIGEPTLDGKSCEFTLPAQPTTQESDELTAINFRGDGGGLSMLHRNSSNGYYGNYLSVNSRGTPPEDAQDGRDWYRQITPDCV